MPHAGSAGHCDDRAGDGRQHCPVAITKVGGDADNEGSSYVDRCRPAYTKHEGAFARAARRQPRQHKAMQASSHDPTRNSGVGLSASCTETKALKAARSAKTCCVGCSTSASHIVRLSAARKFHMKARAMLQIGERMPQDRKQPGLRYCRRAEQAFFALDLSHHEIARLEPPIDVPLGRLVAAVQQQRVLRSLQSTGYWFSFAKWLMPPRSKIMIDCNGCCRVAPSAP